MKYRGNKVTINNYQDIFKNYSTAIKEVIRGAILDDTPLGDYIDKNKNNPYLLWQIKMGLDVGLDSFWLNSCHSGVTLEKIINLVISGINVDILKKHFEYNLDDDYYKYILKWFEKGVSLDEYDFSIVPKHLLDVYDTFLLSGVSMKKYNNGVQYSAEYLNSCVKLEIWGKDNSKFLDGSWDNETLKVICNFAKSSYFDKYIKYIEKDITPAVAEELFDCCKLGMNLEDIAKIEDGVYVYSYIQIHYIKEAYLHKLDYSKLLDSTLSVEDMVVILKELDYKGSRKISGILRKK